MSTAIRFGRRADAADRTVRLVSEVPDFALLYGRSSVTPRIAARLWAAAELLYDEFHRGFAEDVIADLPPIAQLHADERFITAFASRFAVISKRIAEGDGNCESIATCTADEMAVHLIIAQAEVVLIEPDWIEQLPDASDDQDEDDESLDWLLDVLLQDTDVLMLYNPALDGIEDPESPVAQRAGIGYLHPKDWFKPFN